MTLVSDLQNKLISLKHAQLIFSNDDLHMIYNKIREEGTISLDKMLKIILENKNDLTEAACKLYEMSDYVKTINKKKAEIIAEAENPL